MYNAAKTMRSPRYKDKSLGLSLMSTSGLMCDFSGSALLLSIVWGTSFLSRGALAVTRHT